MDVTVVGAGRIGGNIAERLIGAWHAVAVAFSRNPDAPSTARHIAQPTRWP